jgi:hypothetical protein
MFIVDHVFSCLARNAKVAAYLPPRSGSTVPLI